MTWQDRRSDLSETTAGEGIPIYGDAHLRAIARRSMAVWWYLGPILAVAFALAQAFLAPQFFTSTVSIAIQQPTAGTSTLAALTGAGAGKRHIGILKSRRLAQRVNGALHLEKLFGLPGEREAIDFLVRDSVQVREDATGLVFIDVSMPGPPRLSRDTAARNLAKETARVAAAKYAEELRSYYTHEDNAQDAGTLRAARAQLAQSRLDFDRSLRRFTSYVTRDLDKEDPRALPQVESGASTAGGAPSGGQGSSEIGAIYSALAETEVALRTTGAFSATAHALTNAQLADPGSIPAEDPLLADARKAVSTAEQSLKTSELQLGPLNPIVVMNRQRLLLARAELRRQMRGVQQRRTSEDVRSQAEAVQLRTRRTQLLAQLVEAEARLKTRRRLQTQYELLRNECIWRMEALKATAAAAAQVYTTTAALSTRVAVVDQPELPVAGTPRLLSMVSSSVLWAAIAWGIWVAAAYIRTKPPAPAP